MSEEPSGLIYGLEFQCRALCGIEADSDNITFLVGTQSLQDTNQLHCITLDEDSRAVSKIVYSHPDGEVWDLCSSPTKSSLFISRYSKLEDSGPKSCHINAKVFSRYDGDDAEIGGSVDQNSGGTSSASLQLIEKCNLSKPEFDCDINHVSFMPSDGSKVMTLSENKLSLHDIDRVQNGSSTIVTSGCLEGKGYTNLTIGAWNPHQNCQSYAAVNENILRAWDTRNMQQVWRIQNFGNNVIRALDFNPNKQYHLVTGSDDGCLRFWDLRKPVKPLITREDHSHWVWCVKFNPYHDQLVLSASSDSHVKLLCLASISSEPHGYILDETEEDGDEGISTTSPGLKDGLLKSFDDHEESVYAAAWSGADPWTFASLSYDGRLVINNVPREAKFKILNLD